MTVRLAQEIGMDTVAEYAERFGVYDDMPPFLSLLARRAARRRSSRWSRPTPMFANGGERVEPTLVDRVQDRYGKTIYRHDQRVCEDCAADALADGAGPADRQSTAERIMNAITAYQLTSMLQGVVQRGTAPRAVGLPVPELAGKTGTTNEAKDVWFIGYSPEHRRGLLHRLRHAALDGRAPSAATLCAPVFQEFMKEAVARSAAPVIRRCRRAASSSRSTASPARGCPTTPRATTSGANTSATARSRCSALATFDGGLEDGGRPAAGRRRCAPRRGQVTRPPTGGTAGRVRGGNALVRRRSRRAGSTSASALVPRGAAASRRPPSGGPAL